MLNGAAAETDPVKIAQQQLAEIAMKQPMTPHGCSISAYVNGVVNAAMLSALLEHCVGAGPFPPEFEERLLRHIQAKIDIFNRTAKEAPRILSAGHG